MPSPLTPAIWGAAAAPQVLQNPWFAPAVTMSVPSVRLCIKKYGGWSAVMSGMVIDTSTRSVLTTFFRGFKRWTLKFVGDGPEDEINTYSFFSGIY